MQSCKTLLFRATQLPLCLSNKNIQNILLLLGAVINYNNFNLETNSQNTFRNMRNFYKKYKL